MSVPEDRILSADSYPINKQQRELRVAVHYLSAKSDAEATFGMDTLSKGVLPILVIAENHNNASSFILARETVGVISAESAKTSTAQRRTLASGVAGGVFLGIGAVSILMLNPVTALPFIIAGAKLSSDAEVIEHTLYEKTLYSRTIEPGQKTYGYVYFQMPKDIKTLDSYVMRVEAVEAISGEPLIFDFPISINPTLLTER